MPFHRHRGWMLAVGAVLLILIGACSTPVATPSPTSVPTAIPTPRPTRTPRPTPTPSPTPVPTPTPIPLNEDLLSSRVTVLVVGTDSNQDRASRGMAINTDSMIVVSLDADQSHIASVSLPRDAVDIPMPDGSLWTGKVNGMYAQVGLDVLEGALETLYAIDIDYHIVIDMADFGRIVNAVGGIEVNVPSSLSDPAIGLNLAAGVQRLSGNNALRYARSRYVDGDHARAMRQQQLVVALARALVDPAVEIDPSILLTLPSVETNVPLTDVPTLLELGRRARDAEVSHRVLGPDYALFEGMDGARGWIFIPNVMAMRGYVHSVMGGG